MDRALKNILPNAVPQFREIEGYVDPREPLRDEGPFGDHTGYTRNHAVGGPPPSRRLTA